MHDAGRSHFGQKEAPSDLFASARRFPSSVRAFAFAGRQSPVHVSRATPPAGLAGLDLPAPPGSSSGLRLCCSTRGQRRPLPSCYRRLPRRAAKPRSCIHALDRSFPLARSGPPLTLRAFRSVSLPLARLGRFHPAHRPLQFLSAAGCPCSVRCCVPDLSGQAEL